jgi:4-alpha-glucanotransferase
MQDYLGLGRYARMNTPSTVKDNWAWKMGSPDIEESIVEKIREFTLMFNRR